MPKAITGTFFQPSSHLLLAFRGHRYIGAEARSALTIPSHSRWKSPVLHSRQAAMKKSKISFSWHIQLIKDA